MKKSNVSTYNNEAIVMLTVEGRIALAADTLAAADKTRSEEQQKRLCEKVMRYLSPVVQG
jgi:hypothetical protein